MDVKQEDNIIKQTRLQKRLANLERKQKEKTKIDQERPMYYFLVLMKKLIQFCCALMAAAGLAALIGDFTKDISIIIGISIGVLLLLETVISKLLSNITQNRINGREQQPSIIVFLVCCITLSVGSTYLGSESTIKYMKLEPKIVSIDSINNLYESKIKQNTIFWGAKASLFNSQAEDIHNKNSWKGATIRAAKGAVLSNKESAKNMQDSLIKYQAQLIASQNTDITKAKVTNSNIQANHKNTMKRYSNILEVTSLVLYVILFFIVYFIEDHESREKESLRLKFSTIKDKEKVLNPKDKESVEKLQDELIEYKDSVKTEGKDKEDIGFKYKGKETPGDIKTFKNPNKKPRILVPRKDGTLKACKVSELKNWINNTSTEERAKQLEKYLTKLQQHEQQ